MPPATPTPPPAPVTCPFCRVGQGVTTAATATEQTYYRCQGCGQIWNPSRVLNARGGRSWH